MSAKRDKDRKITVQMEYVKWCTHVKICSKLCELGVQREQNAGVNFEKNGQPNKPRFYWEKNTKVNGQWGQLKCKQEAKLASCFLAY